MRSKVLAPTHSKPLPHALKIISALLLMPNPSHSQDPVPAPVLFHRPIFTNTALLNWVKGYFETDARIVRRVVSSIPFKRLPFLLLLLFKPLFNLYRQRIPIIYVLCSTSKRNPSKSHSYHYPMKVPAFHFRVIDHKDRGDRNSEHTGNLRSSTLCSQQTQPTPIRHLESDGRGERFDCNLTPLTPDMSGVAFFAGKGSRLAQRRNRIWHSNERFSLPTRHTPRSNTAPSMSVLDMWTDRGTAASALSTTRLPMDRFSDSKGAVKELADTWTPLNMKSYSQSHLNMVKRTTEPKNLDSFKQKVRDVLNNATDLSKLRRKSTGPGGPSWVKVPSTPSQDIDVDTKTENLATSCKETNRTALRGQRKSEEFETLLQMSGTTMKMSLFPPTGDPYPLSNFTLELS
ncbi:hypothetical protein CROQUDRAFT_91603 [Cronartium quercuum f. sp. fusiforme G11]|uniref:Uncharacterized protein n=1 Tax=Cronartium quercuum f. sp. fusiforme G11 TaxID=708437 RepID=A0A9P6TD12_9BASI|nr:hypothetical protein CROQUDRAFT_91603 [Cronartium quercuum f. sp. fusiforme G11]